MKIEKKLFNREETRKLKQKRAIVIHWPSAKTVKEGFMILNIDSLWGWMNEATKNSYHYLVSKNRIIQTRDLSLRAIHCGHRTYRKKAKDYFGYDVCCSTNSPNNYTIAVCALHDNHTGGYGTDTTDSLVELCADLCIEHRLSPDTDLWRHSDITNEKDIPCPRGFFEDDDDPDDLWNAFKCWVAVAISNKYEQMNHLEQKYDNIKEEK